MRSVYQILTIAAAAALIAGCGQKKQSEDIIATKTEAPKPQAPIRMQPYQQATDIVWQGKNYQVEVKRHPDDSLAMVMDETGQKFIDNRIALRVIRADGSVFFQRTFTKAAFERLLDNDYRQTGILEGLVYDKVEGATLYFAASVSHPQTDEYIPIVVTVSSMGDVDIRLDTQLDTNGGQSNEEEEI